MATTKQEELAIIAWETVIEQRAESTTADGDNPGTPLDWSMLDESEKEQVRERVGWVMEALHHLATTSYQQRARMAVFADASDPSTQE